MQAEIGRDPCGPRGQSQDRKTARELAQGQTSAPSRMNSCTIEALPEGADGSQSSILSSGVPAEMTKSDAMNLLGFGEKRWTSANVTSAQSPC